MSKSSHLELHHDSNSEVLSLLDSVSLPSEPPDIRNWFSSYVYESPELGKLDGFQDSDVGGETCVEEENIEKSRNSHPSGDYSDDFECCKSADEVSGSSESLSFSEPPDIRNWFSSYTYESPLLDTAHDFVIPVCEERDDGKLNVEDLMVSTNADKTEFSGRKNTSDTEVKGPNIVKCTKLDYQSVWKDDDDDDDDDITLQSLPSSRNPISSSMEKNIGSQDGISVYSPTKGTGHVRDGLGNKNISKTVSPRTIDRIVSEGDCRGRNIGTQNETELQEDGFISVRKKSRQENAENVGRFKIGVEPMTNIDKDDKRVRKVLSEISNFHSQNIMGSTGKWSCPQKIKPDPGPPLKQLRLDQWVRRV